MGMCRVYVNDKIVKEHTRQYAKTLLTNYRFFRSNCIDIFVQVRLKHVNRGQYQPFDNKMFHINRRNVTMTLNVTITIGFVATSIGVTENKCLREETYTLMGTQKDIQIL